MTRIRVTGRGLCARLPHHGPAAHRKKDHREDASDKLPRTGVLGGSVVGNRKDQSMGEDGPRGREQLYQEAPADHNHGKRDGKNVVLHDARVHDARA